jgi:hypothetical protein
VLAFDIQALDEDIKEVAEYAKTMSAEDVDEMIDHILAEVNLSVSYHDRTMTDAPVNSTAMTPSVSLCVQEPMPVLNDFTELPSSCSRNLQAVQVRPGAEERPRRVQRVYEELKIEAALIMVVSLKLILTAHVGL